MSKPTTIVAKWTCGCGTHITVLAESAAPGVTSVALCPACRAQQTVHAGKIISEVYWQKIALSATT